MYLFSIENDDKTYRVLGTEHLNKKREKEHYKRGRNYTKEKLYEIFSIAIGSMTQYREKYIAVTFFNENGKTNAVLCKLEGQNIVIVTMLENTKRRVTDVFRRASHIFLREYRFIKPSYAELQEDSKEYKLKIVQKKDIKSHRTGIKKKKANKNVSEINKEDDTFLKSMKNTRRI